MRFAIVLSLCQILLSGCVGFAVSIPGPTQTRQLQNNGANFKDPNFSPREAGRNELVKRDLVKKEIRYETGESNQCLTFLVFLPAYHGDCARVETWSYAESNQITIKTHSHRLIGLWCSPLPYWAGIVLIDVGIGNSAFPFCEIHLGTVMFKNGDLF